MLAWVMNLGFAGGSAPVVVPEPEADKGKDSGGGRVPAWWEGEWITPGVRKKLPKKPAEDVTPLRPRVSKARRRAKALKTETAVSQEQLGRLAGDIGSLSRSVTALEKAAAKVAEEREIAALTERYRLAALRLVEAEQRLAAFEAQVAHKQRILADDHEFLALIARIL